MNYIVIYAYDKKTDMAQACVLSEKPNMQPIIYWKKPVQEIVTLTINNHFKPLNFDIDRKKQLKQTNGSFSRFRKAGSLVILAEFINSKKEVIGYKVISNTNGITYNMTLDDIRQLYLRFKNRLSFNNKEDSIIIIQNAIVRQSDDDIIIACYPSHTFEQIVIKQTEKEGKPLIKSRSDYDIKKILSGIEKDPDVDMEKEVFLRLIKNCVEQLNKDLAGKGKEIIVEVKDKSGNIRKELCKEYPKECYVEVANLVNWVLHFEIINYDMCLQGFFIVRKSDDIVNILLNEAFEAYSPAYSDFLGRNYEYLIELGHGD